MEEIRFGVRAFGQPLAALALLTLATRGSADEVTPAPPPPAIALPETPELGHGGHPGTPEPGDPRGRVRRGGTPSALVENGESGAGGVEDHTDATYDLLQDSVAGQGEFSFHLATHYNHWFKPTPSVAVTAGCKLFFQSRLGWATTDQTATVQVSTDAGASWGATVWTQSGADGSGEGGFTLNEVDLTPFVGETVQVRFLFAFAGGGFYVGADPGVGWYVDNIQIGSAFNKEQYVLFGDPSDDEQHYLEYINRARASAAAEAARLRDETDPLITSAYASFNIDVGDITAQFAWHVNNGCIAEFAQPLPFNVQLLQMARLHTQDMFTNAFQGHVSSASPPAPYMPGDTLTLRRNRIGYSSGVGENVYSSSRSVAHGHAGFNVDWGGSMDSTSGCYNAGHVGQGMQNPPGHRLSIHNPTFREIGIGVINGSNGGVGPQIVTQNMGRGGGIVITGVVYEDTDGDGFYDPGEGLGGVRAETPDSAFFSVTSASGGYAIPVDGDGTHPVTFSGGGVATTTANAVVTGGNNTKLDHIPSSVAGGYAGWAASLGVTGGETGDHDRDGIANLFEYALAGFDPLVWDAELMPALVSSGTASTLTIAKDTGATGVTYGVQVSPDLEAWGDTGFTVVTDNATTLEISLSHTAAEQMYVRIVVTSTPSPASAFPRSRRGG